MMGHRLYYSLVVLCLVVHKFNGELVVPDTPTTEPTVENPVEAEDPEVEKPEKVKDEDTGKCQKPKCIENAVYNNETNTCQCREDLLKPPEGLFRVTQTGFDCYVPCSEEETRVECDHTGQEHCEMQHDGTEWYPVCECRGPLFQRNEHTGRCEPNNVCVSCEYELCPATHECAYTFQPGSSEVYQCVLPSVSCPTDKPLLILGKCYPKTAFYLKKQQQSGRSSVMKSGLSFGLSRVFTDKENRANACMGAREPCHEFADQVPEKNMQLGYECKCQTGYVGNGFHCRPGCHTSPIPDRATDPKGYIDIGPRIHDEQAMADYDCVEETGIKRLSVCYQETNNVTGKAERKCGCDGRTTEVFKDGKLVDCQNVNECETCENKCFRNSMCYDVVITQKECPGKECIGYKCICPPGYINNDCAWYKTCEDDNQCGNPSICEQFSLHMECKDSGQRALLSWFPWYRCQCKMGWRGGWVLDKPFAERNETYCIASCSPFEPLEITTVDGQKITVEAVYTGNYNNKKYLRAGTIAEFRCPPGYLPRYRTAECKEDVYGGNWTHPYECIPACTSLNVDHAHTNCQDHLTMDKGSCAVTCDTTYVLEDGDCTCHGHTWSCQPRCVQPCALISVERGSVRYNPPVRIPVDKPIRGTVATITCDSNHHYDCGMFSMSLSCVEGQWSPGQNQKFFANNKLTCHPPCASLNIDNALAVVNELKPYCKNTEIRCESGYYLTSQKQRIDQASAECRAFAIWSRYPSNDIQCTLGCRNDFIVVNGDVVYIEVKDNLVTDGSSVRTVCHDGYVLRDEGTGKCSSGRISWTTGKAPQCVKYCQKDLVVPHGTIEPNSSNNYTTLLVTGALVYYAGSILELKCKEGFTVIGPHSTTCSEDGNWSIKLGKCVPLCINSELIISNGFGSNFSSSISYTLVGGNVGIQCDEGYSKTKTTKSIYATCQKKGWTFIDGDTGNVCYTQICYPSAPKRIIPNAYNNHTLVFDDRELINGVHTWQCHQGYKATSDITHHQVVGVNTYSPTYLADLNLYCTKACPTLDLSPMIVVHHPVEPDGLYLPRAHAHIHCPAGERYVNEKHRAAECEASGRWKHSTKCAKMCPIVTVKECDVDCPTEQPIIGDRLVIKPKKDHVIYSLTTDQYIERREVVLTCTEFEGKSMFMPQELYTCTPVCTIPNIANAQLKRHLSANHSNSEHGRLLLGECLTIVCTPGHIQTPIIGQRICCVGPETFDSEIPRCVDGCAKFIIQHGEVIAKHADVSTFDVMDKCLIKCHQGYHLEPFGSEGVVYCNYDRRWMPDPTDYKCVKHCDVSELTVIEGGVDHECCNNFIHVGQTVHYTCNAGYYSTSKFVTCRADGLFVDKNTIECQQGFVVNPGVFYMVDLTALVTFSEAEAYCANLNVHLGARAEVLYFPNIMWFYRYTAFVRAKITIAQANLWTAYEKKGNEYVDEHNVLRDLIDKNAAHPDGNMCLSIDKARILSFSTTAYAACLWHAEVTAPICWAPQQLF